jgi:hypothetical protein
MAMAIATSADLPLIQTLGAGVVLRAVARRRVRLQSDNPIADTMTRETIRLNNTRSPDDRYSDSVSDLASNECGVPDDGRFLHATRALHADRAARSDR